MTNDNVVRFGPRRGGDEWGRRPGDLGFRGIGDEPFDEHTGRYDEYGLSRYDDEPRGSDLGTLTNVVLVGSQVIDVTSHPVAGSGYECAVLDLEQRGLYQRPISHQPPPAPPPPPPHERQLAWLATIVGGEEALLALDSTPLPDEPLDLSGVPRHLHARVEAIAGRIDPWVSLAMGDEGLTAARRLLVRAVAAAPGLLRSDRDDIAAGAVVWAAAKGNDLVGQNRPLRASVIQDLAGLLTSPGQRGAAFAHALTGVGTSYGQADWLYGGLRPNVIPLGSPDVLLGSFRQRLITFRDIALQLRARTPVAG